MADRPHPSSVPGGPYDGVTFPYIPKAALDIDPKLQLHTDWTDKIDPITYEVVRSKPWNLNRGQVVSPKVGISSCGMDGTTPTTV